MIAVPPLVYAVSLAQGQRIAGPGFRIERSAKLLMWDAFGGSATFSQQAPCVEGAPGETVAEILVRNGRSRAIGTTREFSPPMVTRDGFARLLSPRDTTPPDPASVHFYGPDLRSRPPSTGIPGAFSTEGLLVRTGTGVVVMSAMLARSGIAYFCEPGRRAVKLRTPGLAGLEPGARRGVWWSGGRTTFALAKGTGAAIRPGRVLWSRKDTGMPWVRFVPGGVEVSRPVEGPGVRPFVSLVTSAGREVRTPSVGRVGAISPDGTLWRIAGSPRALRVERSSGGPWRTVPAPFPKKTLWARFVGAG